MTTLPAPARATYDLTADQAADLHRAATPWHPGSQARADPLYRDRLNNWWAALGLELGFKWTTAADLTWLGVAGKPCAISKEHGEGYGLPNFAEVMGATFTAEPEVAEVPADDDARAWMKANGIVDILRSDRKSMVELAFAAGRDRGFAMGSATVDALERQLASNLETITSMQAQIDGLADRVNTAPMAGKIPIWPHHAARLTGEHVTVPAPRRVPDVFGKIQDGDVVMIDGVEHVISLGREVDMGGPAPTREETNGERYARMASDPLAYVLELEDLAYRDYPTYAGDAIRLVAREVLDLRRLLVDAMPVIEFVNGLATIEDADLDTFAVAQLRNQARGSMGDDGFKRPGTYTEEQQLAASSIFANWWSGKRGGTVGEAVDAIAVALGLRLWTKDGPF